MSVMFMAKTENPEDALQIRISETSPKQTMLKKLYILFLLPSLAYQPLISYHTIEEREIKLFCENHGWCTCKGRV